MTAQIPDLEELYARLALEDDGEEGGVVVERTENSQVKKQYVLIGRFLTEKNINFNAMQNVLASLWRPRESVAIHDIGGNRHSFVFNHIMDIQKVLDGGPWTFEQSLLLYHQLKDGEDPHLVRLNSMDIWVQVYDIPNGLFSDRILQGIGNFVGVFVKSDPSNINGGWKPYARIRVTMKTDMSLKRKMKIKQEGGAWSWVSFKYERLSTFCFVCGMLGHSDRDCAIVYAYPDKEITRAFGTWLRAPTRGAKNQNLGARWLRGGTGETEGNNPWTAAKGSTISVANNQPAKEPNFMEVDGKICETT